MRGERGAAIRDGATVLLLCVLLFALSVVVVLSSFVATFDAQIPPTDSTKVAATIIGGVAGIGCLAVITAIVARVREEALFQVRYGVLLLALVLGSAMIYGSATVALGTDSRVPSTLAVIAGVIALTGGAWAFYADSRRGAVFIFGATLVLAVSSLVIWLGQVDGWPDCEAPELWSGDQEACFSQS